MKFPELEAVLEKLKARDLEIQADRDSKWEIWDIAEEILGRPGQMVSANKTAPKDQEIIWNANVCTREHGKIWFGDLNVTKDSDKLTDLAIRLKTTVYVLREMDARFDNELNPRFDEAVFAFWAE